MTPIPRTVTISETWIWQQRLVGHVLQTIQPQSHLDISPSHFGKHFTDTHNENISQKSSQYNRTKSKLQNFLWVHKHEIEIDVQGITSSEYFNRQYYKIIRDFYCNIHNADTHNGNISQKAHNITEQSQNFKFVHKLTNIKTLPMCIEKHIF